MIVVFVYEINNKLINIEHIKRRKQKNIYIRIIDPSNIKISSGYLTSHKYILALLEDKKEWVSRKIEHLSKQVLDEEYFLFLGKKYPKESLNCSIHDHYKKNTSLIIDPIVMQYANIMNLLPNKVSYRNNKTRWGSCSYKNNISLNIQLLKLPLELIEYVVVHELAHIKHKHHQKEFYKEIEKVLPNYKLLDKTLKNYSIRSV